MPLKGHPWTHENEPRKAPRNHERRTPLIFSSVAHGPDGATWNVMKIGRAAQTCVRFRLFSYQMQRGGKNAKKRAVVGVARKLAVLLHRFWATGEAYQPLRNSREVPKAA